MKVALTEAALDDLFRIANSSIATARYALRRL